MPQFNEKPCQECGTRFKPNGPAARFCPECAAAKAKDANARKAAKHRLKQGMLPVGSGGNQKGAKNPMYKSGIGLYRKIAAQLPWECNRCGKELVKAQWATWAVHHKDHNRENNHLSNLERLCKRCHQIEHKCWENFSKTDEGIVHALSNEGQA